MSEYVEELKRAFPAISSVWLFGSRANGNAKESSDWDFLVFSNEPIHESIRKESRFHSESVDLLLVGEGGEFSMPFGEPNGGSLEQWEWHQIAEYSAEYKGCKWVLDEEAAAEGLTDLGQLICLPLKAYGG